MVAIKQFTNGLEQMSLHRNLTVITQERVETQIIYIDLINDFDLKKIRILISGYGPFPEWKLITIILFSIIGFFILAAGAFLAIRIIKNRPQSIEPDDSPPAVSSARESLITEEPRRSSN